jgi:hypothetical protein
VWLVGFALALVSYLDGGRLVWVPDGAEAQRDWQVLTEQGTQTREGVLVPKGQHLFPTRPETPGDSLPPAQQPHVRLARHKLLGFVFAVTLFFVYLHSNVLWRGFLAYFFLALVVVALLAITVIHATLPTWHAWWWVGHLVYQLPDIYISLDGYLFISSVILAVWLFVTLVYDHWTYMRIESGQVWLVEEVGQGEIVYDTTNMTFEKEKEDLFRHHILGLGFVRMLRLLVPRGIARRLGLQRMTGTGDLIVRIGGDSGKVIQWPNVLNIDAKLEQLTTLIKSRPVVEEDGRLAEQYVRTD